MKSDEIDLKILRKGNNRVYDHFKVSVVLIILTCIIIYILLI